MHELLFVKIQYKHQIYSGKRSIRGFYKFCPGYLPCFFYHLKINKAIYFLYQQKRQIPNL